MKKDRDFFLNNINKKIYNFSPELILIIFLIVFHLKMDITTGDFNWFSHILDTKNMPEYWVWRYSTWSSRLLIETLLILFTHIPIVWHIIDIALCVLLAVSVRNIISTRDEYSAYLNWIVLLVLACYPILDMSSAGWIPTTMNYLWPLSFGLFSISMIIRHIRELGDTTNKYNDKKSLVIGSLFSTVFAANAEQMALLLFGYTLIFIMYIKIRYKKWSVFVLLHFAISALSLLFIVTCPGNTVRSAEEALNWWPDSVHYISNVPFDDLSFFEKAWLGITTTLDRYLYHANSIMCCFAVVIFVSIAICYRRRSSKWKVVVTGITSFLIVLRYFVSYIESYLPNWLIPYLNHSSYQITAGRIILLFLQLVFCLTIFLEIYWLYSSWSLNYFTSILIPLSGFLSAVIMGYSPTVFASGARVYIYMDVSLILLTAYLANSFIRKETVEIKTNVLSVVFVFALFTVVQCM